MSRSLEQLSNSSVGGSGSALVATRSGTAAFAGARAPCLPRPVYDADWAIILADALGRDPLMVPSRVVGRLRIGDEPFRSHRHVDAEQFTAMRSGAEWPVGEIDGERRSSPICARHRHDPRERQAAASDEASMVHGSCCRASGMAWRDAM